MPEYKENLGIQEKVSIILTGPDGKVKDKREIGGKDAGDKGPGA
jgi:hypothetical protein